MWVVCYAGVPWAWFLFCIVHWQGRAVWQGYERCTVYRRNMYNKVAINTIYIPRHLCLCSVWGGNRQESSSCSLVRISLHVQTGTTLIFITSFLKTELCISLYHSFNLGIVSYPGQGFILAREHWYVQYRQQQLVPICHMNHNIIDSSS